MAKEKQKSHLTGMGDFILSTENSFMELKKPMDDKNIFAILVWEAKLVW